ncbi:hypothetical protein HYQ44_008812 [Verticillium longisporum]|nr:hypothetical protein HYQ44_008812 [Verticillium longisporum]
MPAHAVPYHAPLAGHTDAHSFCSATRPDSRSPALITCSGLYRLVDLTPCWVLPSTPPILTHDIHWQQSSGANRLDPVKVDAEQSIPNLESLLCAPSLMSRRYYIETSPSGRPQFVTLKRSRSHHHHHHHRPIEHDNCFVSREDWKALVERERCLRDANDVLTHDNYTLKCTLQATDGELRRYQAWVPQLQDRIQCLAADNAALKRSLDSAGGHSEKHYREIERLKQRLLKADREIGGLNDRLKDMLRRAGHGVQDRIDDLTGIIHDWKRKFEVVDEHNIRLRRDLDNRNSVISEQCERIDAYERIMRRHGLVPR